MGDDPLGQVVSFPITPSSASMVCEEEEEPAICLDPSDEYVENTPPLQYEQWLSSVVQRPYLANPAIQDQVNRLLEKAHRLQISSAELREVYQAARPTHTVADRIARLRAYLFLEEATRVNPKVGFLPLDFKVFVSKALWALKTPGAVNIQEADEILDGLGRPLSAEYQELNDRTVRLSRSVLNEDSEDWLRYVVYHELEHWYSASQKRQKGSYEEEELEATVFGMRVFTAVMNGNVDGLKNRLQRTRTHAHSDKLSSIESGIRSLPLPLQSGFSLVWKNLRSNFIDEQLRPTYLSKVFEIVQQEWKGEKPAEGLLQEAMVLLRGRRFATELVQEMALLVDGAKQRGTLCREGGCRSDLEQILSLAVEGQTSLALTKLGHHLKTYQNGHFPNEATLGTP